MLHNICYLAHTSYYIVEPTFISDLISDKLWISSDKKQGENTICRVTFKNYKQQCKGNIIISQDRSIMTDQHVKIKGKTISHHQQQQLELLTPRIVDHGFVSLSPNSDLTIWCGSRNHDLSGQSVVVSRWKLSRCGKCVPNIVLVSCSKLIEYRVLMQPPAFARHPLQLSNHRTVVYWVFVIFCYTLWTRLLFVEKKQTRKSISPIINNFCTNNQSKVKSTKLFCFLPVVSCLHSFHIASCLHMLHLLMHRASVIYLIFRSLDAVNTQLLIQFDFSSFDYLVKKKWNSLCKKAWTTRGHHLPIDWQVQNCWSVMLFVKGKYTFSLKQRKNTTGIHTYVCVTNLVSDCRQSVHQFLQPLVSLSHLCKD